MGGTDEPSNIVRLTRAKHANAHRILYEQYGKHEDLWAWKFLSRSKDWEWMRSDNPMKRPEVRAKVSRTMKERHRIHPDSKDTREKKRISKLGDKNPSFGKHGFLAAAHQKGKCPHCGIETTLGNLHRWHNDNCKQRL